MHQPFLWDWSHDKPHFRPEPNKWGCVCKCECPDCMNVWDMCVCDECPADNRIGDCDD